MRTTRVTRSRLNKRLENNSKKNLLLTVFGIFAIIILIIKFGVPLIINFTLFISGSKDFEQTVKHEDASFIPPPILNPMPTATNSAEVVISGVAFSNQAINLYINNTLVSKTKTQKNGDFSFRETLEERENAIKTKAEAHGKESEFSSTLNISYINTPPSLTIISPADGQSFSKDQNSIEVGGTTDSQVRVTVNDFWAITDQSNRFSYTLPLKSGDNQIKIVATDQAGNKTEKTVKVTYNP